MTRAWLLERAAHFALSAQDMARPLAWRITYAARAELAALYAARAPA